MAIPYQTLSIIKNDGFNPYHRIDSDYREKSLYSIYSGNSIAMIIPVKESGFFIPTIAFKEIEKNLLSMSCIAGVNKTYMLPLTVSSSESRSTSPSIIKYLLRHENCLLKKITTQSSTYIGGTGLIMSDNYTPMMMWGYNGKIVASLNKVWISNPTVYVNPSLFSSTDILSKYLIKSIMPTLANTMVNSYNLLRLNSRFIPKRESQTVRIIVEDFSHMLYKPSAPTNINYSEEINNKLANDSRRILSGLD